MTTDPVALRRCHTIEDFRACVALQKEVWNFTDAELVPLRMFVVADKVGGQVMGAFDGDGWSASLCRSRARAPAISICTRTCWRCARTIATAGLGRRLKLLQRDDGARARHRTDRVDLRSAGNQERLSQPREAGRDRAPLQHQPVRHHRRLRCREVCLAIA